MKRTYHLIALLLTVLISCTTTFKSKPMSTNYPTSHRGKVVDIYFEEHVPDPYRWLEDDRSKETNEWVIAQNKFTFSHLNKIPLRKKLKERLEKIWNYEKIGAPFQEGEYTYFYKNNGLQNQYVLYRSKGTEEPQVFLDPNTFSKDGTISLGVVSFSKDGSKLAYSISEDGSDWRKVIVMNALTNEVLEDTITDVKFSGLSWSANNGFYYSSYDKPKGSELSAKTDQHKLYFHKLGTPQNEDQLIFGNTIKRRYVGGQVTEDGRYLVISAATSTSGNELYIKDLSSDSSIVTVIDNFESDNYLIDNDGSKLFLVTNLNAPNKKIISVDASNPQPENWKDFIKETDHVLNPSKGSGYFFATYMIDAISKIIQYDKQGNRIRTIKLPGKGSVSGLSGKRDAKDLFYTFSNYITPETIYKYNQNSGESTVFNHSTIAFDSSLYESKQLFYTSKDGTKIPMIISHKKGLKIDGNNPTILYGYGGFNISLTPSFSITNAVWMEQGGVYAVPNIRGGGEYGQDWHNAGTKMQKQNVFDDFISAAEYLIANKYTSSNYLAIRGGSNGGLLVGAVMTQRPDLMKVALPAVGVLDMLRYHTFTAGAGWAYDYGTAEDSKEMFRYLKNYSPVHNVKPNVSYPATLITTGDHDDRVVPAHSFKFAAALQDKQNGENLILIRIETNAGHGAGTPVSKTIAQYADIYAFTLWNMGIK